MRIRSFAMWRNDMPTPERTYQNFLMDSTRWDRIKEREGDIVIATPYKCGTTWT